MAKRHKGVLTVVIFSLLIAIATGCNNDGESLSVKARSGKQEILVPKENEQSFASLLAGKELTDIPYIKLGSKVTTFGGQDLRRAEFNIEDILLAMDGRPKYKGVNTSIDLKHRGNKVSFKLPVNPSAFLSSNSEDYLPGKTLRGFRLTYQLDNETYSSIFVLRTDAN
jgi:hypothetical protein